LSLGCEHSFQLSDKSMLYLNPSISRGIDAFDALNDDESGLDLKAKTLSFLEPTSFLVITPLNFE
jgi:hypothetical protein